jgi:hypothetical protein
MPLLPAEVARLRTTRTLDEPSEFRFRPFMAARTIEKMPRRRAFGASILARTDKKR